jgi:hypothetical protein
MQKNIRLMPVLMALAIVMGACVPQQATTTQSPQEAAAQVGTSVAMTLDAQGQIATFVAQTVEAQNTGTAAALPQFTATPLPLSTPISILPTATPFVVSGGGGGGGGGGGSNPAPTKQQYDCAVVSQVPGDGTAFKPGKEIDIRWIVKNTGTKTWEPTWSFSFFQGTNFSITGSYTLGKQVKRNETIALELDAIVPHGEARYDKPQVIYMKWAIKGDGSRFCTPYVGIKVSLSGE